MLGAAARRTVCRGFVCRRRGLSSARFAAAEAALESLPELKAARATPDAAAAYDHLKRALDIVSNVGDRKLVIVGHGHLVRLCYNVGLAEAERAHRVAAIDELLLDEAEAGDGESMLSAAYNGLALSCLRVGGSESLLAASTAAGAAEKYAQSVPMRLGAALHAALARPRGSDGQRLLLSAVANQDGGGAVAGPGAVDVAGLATLFLAVGAESDGGGPSDERALGRLRALLDRWAERDDFDLVEAQCAAARQYVLRGPGGAGANSANLDAAEAVLAVALKSAQRLGNRLDTSEPVLALAHLYAAMNRKVEAEGMFRSVEDRFAGLKSRRAFTVLTGEVYCRAVEEFARFLDGLGRRAEAEARRKGAAEVRALFPAILGGGQLPVPLWVVDSCIERYAVPQPFTL
jgi:hypothetical protein